MSNHFHEFVSLALIHLLAVIAPGPDFAVTVRQSVRHGRWAGVQVAIGIGAGISVHVLYTLLGVGALLHANALLMTATRMLGASYLLYLVFSFLRGAGRSSSAGKLEGTGTASALGWRRSFLLGFVTNATNPKATLFFLAIFTTVVSAGTPLKVQVLYGIWMCLVNASWFVLVSVLFTQQAVRDRFLRMGGWLEGMMALVFLVFAGRLLWEVASNLPLLVGE